MTSSIETRNRQSESGQRLTMVRRLYFYLVALISLIVSLFALDELVRVLISVWLGEDALYAVNAGAYVRDTVARNGGLLLVSAPIFLLHWGYMQRRQDEPGETQAALRKLFLYTASGFCVCILLAKTYALVYGVALLAFGLPLNESAIWPAPWLDHLLMATAALALLAYFRETLRRDGDYGAEQGASGTLRRIYQTAIGLTGLLLIVFGGAGALEVLWQILFDTAGGTQLYSWWRVPLANGLTMLLLGLIVARINGATWRVIIAEHPRESQSALRRLYLYGAVVIGALTTLIPLANLLNELLLLVFGARNVSTGEIMDGLTTPLAFAPVGLVVWLWHSRYLGREVERYADSPESATIRRLYNYAVSATGLALAWAGAALLLQATLDWIFMRGSSLDGRVWAEPLAAGLSLVVVGAPIWVLHWRAVQAIALRPDDEGLAERASGPRRVYLYGVAFVAALLILFDLAQVVYRFLLIVLGEPGAQLFTPETAAEVARALIALFVLWMHASAIRRDVELGAAIEEGEKREGDVVARAEALRVRIEELENELAVTRAELQQIEEDASLETHVDRPAVD